MNGGNKKNQILILFFFQKPSSIGRRSRNPINRKTLALKQGRNLMQLSFHANLTATILQPHTVFNNSISSHFIKANFVNYFNNERGPDQSKL